MSDFIYFPSKTEVHRVQFLQFSDWLQSWEVVSHYFPTTKNAYDYAKARRDNLKISNISIETFRSVEALRDGENK